MLPSATALKSLYAAHVVFTARTMPSLIVEELALYVGTDQGAIERAATRYGRRQEGAEWETSLLSRPTRLVFRGIRQVLNMGTYGAREVAALRGPIVVSTSSFVLQQGAFRAFMNGEGAVVLLESY